MFIVVNVTTGQKDYVKVDDALCADIPPAPTEQYCNMFHCQLECRVDTNEKRS